MKFKIAAINIISSTDWDEDHPAGTSLNDLVSLRERINEDFRYSRKLVLS